MPTAVARSVPGVVGVTLTGSYLCASLSEGVHSATTDVSLFRVLRSCHILRHQSEQRTLGAAVGLLRWQLNLYDVSLRHFIFLLSGKYSFAMVVASKVVASFRVICPYDVGKKYPPQKELYG